MKIIHYIKFSVVVLFGHGGAVLAADDCKVPRIDCDIVDSTPAASDSMRYLWPNDMIAAGLGSGSSLLQQLPEFGYTNQFNKVGLNKQSANYGLGT
ncbi:MAG: hypothetical protein OER96_05545 [Gammaproteobacteria bacterium]|nr:hypothetical protein [Gammaproteobacteria bacterium]